MTSMNKDEASDDDIDILSTSNKNNNAPSTNNVYSSLIAMESDNNISN